MKYRCKNTGTVYTVVFSDERGMLIENVATVRSWWTKKEVERLFEEYREPRTAKGYANIWERPDGSIKIGLPLDTREEAELVISAVNDRLDIIEISWTEKV